MEKAELTRYIKSEALRLGFDICGIAKAEAVDKAIQAQYNSWIKDGRQGTMQYLERHCEKRFDPTLLVEGCRSVIAVAMNYHPQQKIAGISDYAVGSDYHKAVKDRLFLLMKSINEKHPVKGRAFCDSAPVLERYWAVQAGLGWIGRNRQLIIPDKGSSFFLGELFIDIELEYDKPFDKNRCGECRRCFDACPGKALDEHGIDARKCLSYLTIEYRGELPQETACMMEGSFYGCDRCREACPHNRFSTPNGIAELQPNPVLLEMEKEEWENLTEEKYKTLFAGSAVERCGYEQLVRNIKAMKKQTGCP